MMGILEAQGHHCPGGDSPMKPPSHLLGNALLPVSGGPLAGALSDRRFFSSLDTLSPIGFLLLLRHLPAQPHRHTSFSRKQVEGCWCQPRTENRDTTPSLGVSGGPAVFFHLFS